MPDAGTTRETAPAPSAQMALRSPLAALASLRTGSTLPHQNKTWKPSLHLGVTPTGTCPWPLGPCPALSGLLPLAHLMLQLTHCGRQRTPETHMGPLLLSGLETPFSPRCSVSVQSPNPMPTSSADGSLLPYTPTNTSSIPRALSPVPILPSPPGPPHQLHAAHSLRCLRLQPSVGHSLRTACSWPPPSRCLMGFKLSSASPTTNTCHPPGPGTSPACLTAFQGLPLQY